MKSTEVREMATMLARRGYDPHAAESLHAEGMGPEELRDRLTFRSGVMGSLDYTHSLHRVIGLPVTLPRGLRVGGGALREDTDGSVVGVQLSDNGSTMFHVQFLYTRGHKTGRERTTWVTRGEVRGLE